MTYPKILAYQQLTAAQSAQNAGGALTSFVVNAGDSVYVFASYGTNSTGSTKILSVTDSSGNLYSQAAFIQNLVYQDGASGDYLAEEIWYADNVPANSALTVTFAFTSNTFYVVSGADISGAAGAGVSLDVVSSGQVGSGTTSSDPIVPVSSNDLVIALWCAFRPTGIPIIGGGFTSTMGNTSGGSVATPKDLTSSLYYLNAAAAGQQNSSLSWATTEPFAIITIAIKPILAWVNLKGKPYFTVSSTGLKTTPSAPTANNGADFGPDSPSTLTSGLQEAINFVYSLGGGVVELINESGTYGTPTSGIVVEGSVVYQIKTELIFLPGVNIKGNGATIQYATEGANVFPFATETQTSSLKDIYYRTSIDDVILDGNGCTNAVFTISNAQRCRFNLKVQNGAEGVKLDCYEPEPDVDPVEAELNWNSGLNEFWLDIRQITNIGLHLLGYYPSGPTGAVVTDNVFHKVYMTNIGGVGIWIDRYCDSCHLNILR